MSIYEHDAEKHIRMERETAREEGREEGKEEGIELTRRLMEENRFEDLKRAVEDEAYRKRLFLEYGIG